MLWWETSKNKLFKETATSINQPGRSVQMSSDEINRLKIKVIHIKPTHFGLTWRSIHKWKHKWKSLTKPCKITHIIKCWDHYLTLRQVRYILQKQSSSSMEYMKVLIKKPAANRKYEIHIYKKRKYNIRNKRTAKN